MDSEIRYFSMFSGIGGFELGIQNAYAIRDTDEGELNTSRHQPDNSSELSQKRRQQPVCIGYSEIDAPAIKTYERHFEHENFGDAKQLHTEHHPEQLPDFDLLVGGFPCQSFSVAGRRRGFLDETRGTLFFDIARILKEKRPRHLVLENVKGLLSHDVGKTFQTILGVLADLGYRVEWQLLNSKNFGVPQNRERIYIVGHLREECRGKVFPITSSDKAYSQKFSSTTIDANYWKGIDNHGARTAIGEGLSETGSFSNNSDTRRGGSYPKIRRLTPIECERLQGFPDNWTIGSDTQRYKQCGNAVTVNVVEAVFSSMKEACNG